MSESALFVVVLLACLVEAVNAATELCKSTAPWAFSRHQIEARKGGSGGMP